MRVVLTGQPPDRPGRSAIGPISSSQTDRVLRRLAGLGWTEVWAVPLDEKLTERVRSST